MCIDRHAFEIIIIKKRISSKRKTKFEAILVGRLRDLEYSSRDGIWFHSMTKRKKDDEEEKNNTLLSIIPTHRFITWFFAQRIPCSGTAQQREAKKPESNWIVMTISAVDTIWKNSTNANTQNNCNTMRYGCGNIWLSEKSLDRARRRRPFHQHILSFCLLYCHKSRSSYTYISIHINAVHTHLHFVRAAAVCQTPNCFINNSFIWQR